MLNANATARVMIATSATAGVRVSPRMTNRNSASLTMRASNLLGRTPVGAPKFYEEL
jgi:hypothetical protein